MAEGRNVDRRAWLELQAARFWRCDAVRQGKKRVSRDGLIWQSCV